MTIMPLCIIAMTIIGLLRAAGLVYSRFMIKLIVRDLAGAAGIGNALVLSRQSGLAYAMCYKLWNDQQTRIDLTTIDRLCEVLRCAPGDLFVREAQTDGRNKQEVPPTKKATPDRAAAEIEGASVSRNKCRRIRWID
jgi:DNA-binding Xre family transcriptional regulator